MVLVVIVAGRQAGHGEVTRRHSIRFDRQSATADAPDFAAFKQVAGMGWTMARDPPAIPLKQGKSGGRHRRLLASPLQVFLVRDDGLATSRNFIRTRCVSKGDVAVVDEAERGEDHIKAKFEKAKDDTDLSPAVEQFVASAAARVKAGHDKIRDLKHSLHGK